MDKNEPVFVTVDERPQKHAPHQRENGRVGADAEGQREHHGDYQPFAARQRPDREFQVVHEGQDGLAGWGIFRLALVHRRYSFEYAAK